MIIVMTIIVIMVMTIIILILLNGAQLVSHKFISSISQNAQQLKGGGRRIFEISLFL